MGSMTQEEINVGLFDEVKALRAESDAFRKLLSEAVKIVHANSRNINKDWLVRARATLRGVKP